MTFKKKPLSPWRQAVLATGPQARPVRRAERPTATLALRSEKMTRTYETRRELVREMLTATHRCEAGALIYDYLISLGIKPSAPAVITRSLTCGGNAPPVDVHELLPRSAGGSITERSNCIAICRTCHDWIHLNSGAARKIGLLKSRYMARSV